MWLIDLNAIAYQLNKKKFGLLFGAGARAGSIQRDLSKVTLRKDNCVSIVLRYATESVLTKYHTNHFRIKSEIK